MNGGTPSRIRERTDCRVCGSTALARVMDFGAQAVAGAFPPQGTGGNADRFPLELVRCDPEADPGACGLVQLRHSINPHLLYDAYWYRSGINRTMTDNLHEIAHQAAQLHGGLSDGDLVIDVGCNDGTLLDGYAHVAPEGVAYLGIDPSDVTTHARAKGYHVVNTFFSREAVRSFAGATRAAIISSIAMFYDLEDPSHFVREVAESLAYDGVWVSEFSYMPTMLRMNSFDTVCHEHLEYYSFSVIERVVESAGLEVLRAELNDVNGGSIRLFVGHRGWLSPSAVDAAQLQSMRDEEQLIGLGTGAPYAAFAERSARVRDVLRETLRRINSEGGSVHVYGASTKGNTTLQYAGIDHTLIPVAADRNPDKWGRETIGTAIPIVSEQESRALVPDYYLVLPWHFLDEMVEREAEFLGRGGQFIIPMPDVRMIGRDRKDG
jgi:NDP-4-keto-2,6-dideoxyhexose 3-C-methyltransferase